MTLRNSLKRALTNAVAESGGSLSLSTVLRPLPGRRTDVLLVVTGPTFSREFNVHRVSLDAADDARSNVLGAATIFVHEVGGCVR